MKNIYILKPIIIQGFETDYVASSDGRILLNGTLSECKYFIRPKGYIWVRLSRQHVDARIKRLSYAVHRLVLAAFYPVKNMDKLTVDHLDKDKSNNDISNLEWVTYEENSRRSHLFGRNYPKGVNANHLKYTAEQIKEVCRLLELNQMTISEISDFTDVSKDTIGKIKAKVQWTDISKGYNIPDTKPNVTVKTYTDEQRQTVKNIILSNPDTKTMDIMIGANLEINSASRMFINRIRILMMKEGII